MGYTNLQRMLVSLRNASVSKKVYVVVNATTLNIRILTLLYDRGFIGGYSCYSTYKVRVFLKYLKSNGLLEHISVPNRQSKFYIRSYKWLRRNVNNMFRLHFLMVLSTKKGVITVEELFRRRLCVGGVVLFYIRYI